MSSFPLTNSYFSRWLLHHQPAYIWNFGWWSEKGAIPSAARFLFRCGLFSPPVFRGSKEFPVGFSDVFFFSVWHQKNEEIYALKNHHLILKSLHPERGCFYLFPGLFHRSTSIFPHFFWGQTTDLHCEVVVASSGHGVFSHQSSHCGGRRPWRWHGEKMLGQLRPWRWESLIFFNRFWDILGYTLWLWLT